MECEGTESYRLFLEKLYVDTAYSEETSAIISVEKSQEISEEIILETSMQTTL